MRSFVLTPRLKAAFAAVNSHGKLDESEKQKFEVYAAAELREDCPEDPVPLSVVQRLSEILRSDSHRGLITEPYVHQLLQGSKFYFAPKPTAEKNEELEKRLQRLRVELGNREYANMVRSVTGADPTSMQIFDKQADPLDFTSAKRLVFGMMNVGFTVVALFVGVYVAAGKMTDDQAMRALLALFAALVVAVAEGWFFLRAALTEKEIVVNPRSPEILVGKPKAAPSITLPPVEAIPSSSD